MHNTSNVNPAWYSGHVGNVILKKKVQIFRLALKQGAFDVTNSRTILLECLKEYVSYRFLYHFGALAGCTAFSVLFFAP